MKKIERKVKHKALVNEVLDDLLGLQEQDRQKFMAVIKDSDTEWTPALTKLVDQIIAHYEKYYRVITKLIKGNVRVLLFVSPEWPSHLEDPFLWVGGWRPSMAFHLLDFNPELKLGVGLGKLLSGVNISGFKDISPSQFIRVGELQRYTMREEAELTHSLADTDAQAGEDIESDLVMAEKNSATAPTANNDHHELGEIFSKADDLRLETLKQFVKILSPIQAVQLFIPAAQLHLKVEAWGKNKWDAHTRKLHAHDSNKSNGDTEPSDNIFGGFFKIWLRQKEADLLELQSAAVAYTETTRSIHETNQNLRRLVRRVLSNYEHYYRVKSESVKQNVLHMMTPSWRSLLEHAFLWIGGWRPSTAFHLLYTIVGLQLDAGLTKLLDGLRTGDLADLSESQLAQVNELQMKTVKDERELTEVMAAVQETVADSSIVRLLGVVGSSESDDERVESTLVTKEDKLKEIFEKADDLRMKTLSNVVGILNPIQAVHFLIAAAGLQLRLHEWGKKKDKAGALVIAMKT
ncbi:bZIP transcription factor TGA10-like [Chenopodium quinoa]|uniref:DOG1 domain-containing protein n=1 Tax=Chenopodium quinoa TaxID=63459 RepID=A0A803KNE2_CHEQI|nr:bZIP transcription factor TGA10-like [Chenopodium quinoa]